MVITLAIADLQVCVGTVESDYSDLLRLDKIVWIIEGMDSRKYEFNNLLYILNHSTLS